MARSLVNRPSLSQALPSSRVGCRDSLCTCISYNFVNYASYITVPSWPRYGPTYVEYSTSLVDRRKVHTYHVCMDPCPYFHSSGSIVSATTPIWYHTATYSAALVHIWRYGVYTCLLIMIFTYDMIEVRSAERWIRGLSAQDGIFGCSLPTSVNGLT